jgi:hypothetical protein
MAGTRRAGASATIWMDTSSAGTMAATGTVNLAKVTSKASWTINQDRNFVDVTSFEDSSETSVAGFAGASGDFGGFLDFADNLIWNALGSSTERALLIFPDATNNATTYWQCKAFISGTTGGAVDGAVTQTITWQAGPAGGSWVHP